MTLILTVVTTEKVVQASDRRLTIAGQGVFDDEANKAVCVSCKDAAFCVAYTGLGLIGSKLQRTDAWLADTLTIMQAGRRTLLEICESLQSATRAALRPVNTSQPQQKRLTFVLAGFCMGQGFLASISNQEDESMKLLPSPRPDFRTHIRVIRQGAHRNRALIFSCSGAEAALDVIEPRLRKLFRGRFFQRADPGAAAPELVMLIRAAARSSSAQGYIGRSCMTSSLVIGADPGFTCDYYSSDARPQEYMPHLILGDSSFKDIEIWPGDGPPLWWQGPPAEPEGTTRSQRDRPS